MTLPAAMPTIRRMKFLLLLTGLVAATQGLAASSQERPLAFPDLAQGAYSSIAASALPARGAQRALIRLRGESVSFEVRARSTHANGDESVLAQAADGRGEALLTLGRGAAFGRLTRDGRHYQLGSDASGTWLVELPERAQYNSCATPPAKPKLETLLPQDRVDAEAATRPHSNHAAGTVIDLLIAYNPELAQRYPGGLLETRANHLVFLANQAMANSDIDLGFRLVQLQPVAYRNDNSNEVALAEVSAHLRGINYPDLAGLRQARDASGADLVILIRPHDAELRGSCGIAYYPDGEPGRGVNIVSDGMSSWSLCTDDVFVHEIGHNLGAAHQAGEGGGSFDPRGAAFTLPGQASTVMASFSTGRPDRFRGLLAFSSPQITCAGRPCGRASDTDNAAVMRTVTGLVAGYRPGSSGLPLPERLGRIDSDADGDGASDWLDHFPFDPAETADADLDGAGDGADAFPGDPSEQRDNDGDGSGDHADPDDDNDGVPDAADAFPLLASEQADSDLDGSGDHADEFPFDPQEQRDTDGDGTGDHADADDDDDGLEELDPVAEDFLVVSAGNNRILRFDAHSGEPRGIEVLPTDSLLTFQSALAWRLSDHSLLYLGDSSVRRSDLLSRTALGLWVPPFDDNGDFGAELESGFPTGLAFFDSGATVLVSRDTHASPAVFAGQGRARSGFSDWPLPDDEQATDIVAGGDVAYLLGRATGSVYRLERTGAVTTLAGPRASWMGDPRRMALTPDGRLLLSDRGRNAVVALDAGNGAFLGDLAHLSATGYAEPDGLALTRDGELLVASATGDAVLAFDAQSGAFRDVRVPPGSGGLDGPRALVVLPALLDRLGRDPRRQFRPNAGLWYDPRSSGRGFDIQVYGTRLTALWYAYDEAGQPAWYYAAGELQGFSFDAPLLRFRLDPQGVASHEQVGALSLQFESERRAGMTFSYGTHQGSESLQWLAFDVEPASHDSTGLWGRDDGPGWGLSVARQGDISVAIAFIYDGDGAARWMLSSPARGESPLQLSMLHYTSDTLCLDCSGQSGYSFTPAGSMQLRMPPEPAAWTSAVAWPTPLQGEWLLDAIALRRFSDLPERPR